MGSSILLLTITAALLLALVTIDNAEAAVFAKYDGIDGEATDSKHDKWIDILSVDFKAKKPGAGATGESRRRGAAIIDDFVLTMEYDKASPKLMEKLLKGEVIPKLEIEFTSTFGGARATYLKWELINVQVTDYFFSGSGSDIGNPTVVVGNNFEEIKVTYTEFDSEGNTKGNVEAEFKVGKGE